jgi:putative membrane protein
VIFIALLRVSINYLKKNHLHDVSLLNDNQKLLALEQNDEERLSTQVAQNVAKETKGKEENPS